MPKVRIEIETDNDSAVQFLVEKAVEIVRGEQTVNALIVKEK